MPLFLVGGKMLGIDEIKNFKKRYATDPDCIYTKVRSEQKTDQSYRDDTFKVDEIREPHKVWRSGLGARMVDAPAEQIITSNPQAFFETVSKNKEAINRISQVVNQNWIPILRRQNPNPFKEFVKNDLGRGESFIKVCHNEGWVTNPIGTDKDKLPIFNRQGLPVFFLLLDPMVIYASPEEDENGIPERVIIKYERQPLDVIVRYSKWTNPKRDEKGNKGVEWLEYWDKDTMYFEADEETVLHKPNPYNFVPFVRKYSGFGRRSPSGELADLIVSDIRLSRDLIKQECITRSNIASIEHIFAHRPKTLITQGEISDKQLAELQWGAYDLNVLTGVTPDTKFIEEEYPSVPPEMYQNLANIKAEIAQRNPLIMSGFPFGSSGRQQDLSSMAAMRRYDSIIENTENAFATAFEMALKICKVIPTLKPDGLNKGDLDAKYKCQVKLKAEDPIEQDRLATLGSRLLAQSEIDPITNLTEYKGYTMDEARKILVDILKWRVLLGSPDIAELIGLRAAEKSGMAEDLQYIKARRQELEKGLGKTPTKTGMERTLGETETPLGAEAGILPGRGARRPPTRYERGGV